MARLVSQRASYDSLTFRDAIPFGNDISESFIATRSSSPPHRVSSSLLLLVVDLFAHMPFLSLPPSPSHTDATRNGDLSSSSSSSQKKGLSSSEDHRHGETKRRRSKDEERDGSVAKEEKKEKRKGVSSSPTSSSSNTRARSPPPHSKKPKSVEGHHEPSSTRDHDARGSSPSRHKASNGSSQKTKKKKIAKLPSLGGSSSRVTGIEYEKSPTNRAYLRTFSRVVGKRGEPLVWYKKSGAPWWTGMICSPDDPYLNPPLRPDERVLRPDRILVRYKARRLSHLHRATRLF